MHRNCMFALKTATEQRPSGEEEEEKEKEKRGEKLKIDSSGNMSAFSCSWGNALSTPVSSCIMLYIEFG
jgi:hypothetical protein